jgi:hypothetical protein
MFTGIPNLTARVKGKKVLDTRTSATGYSSNPAMCLRDYLTNDEYGKGIASGDLDATSFNTAANDCDSGVQTISHTSVPVLLASTVTDRVKLQNESDFNKIKTGTTIAFASGGTTYFSGRVLDKDSTIFREEGDSATSYGQHYYLLMDEGAVTTAITSTTSGTITETQPRFECHAAIDTDETVLENTKDLIANMRGIFTYTNGTYSLDVEGTESSVVSLDEDDILESGLELALENKEQKYNKVEVEFYNSSKKYEADTVVVTDGLSDDGNEVLEHRAQFPFVTNQRVAYNHAEAILNRSRNNRSVSFVATPKVLKARVGEVITITSSDLNLSAEPYRITQMNIMPDLNIQVSAVEYQASVYGWQDPPAEDIGSNPTPPDPFRVVKPTSLAYVAKNTTTGEPAKLTWSDSVEYPSFEFRVQILSDSNSKTRFDKRVKATEIYLDGINIDTGFFAKVSAINSLGTESDPVELTFAVTTAPITTVDIGQGSIGGFSFDATKMYHGTGTFNNTNTAVYFDNTGQFSLKDKLSWNGTTLNISGNLTVENTINANKIVLDGNNLADLFSSTSSGVNSTISTNSKIQRFNWVDGTSTTHYGLYIDNTGTYGQIGIGTVSQPSDAIHVYNSGARLRLETASGGYVRVKGSGASMELEAGNTGSGYDNTASILLDISGNDVAKFHALGGMELPSLTPSTTTNRLYQNSGTLFWNGNQVGVGAITSVTNMADNRVLTASGSNSLNGEANMTFDGTTLALTGNQTISGNLTVSGTTTTIDTTNLDVKDKNITLNYGSGDTSSNANGAGITIQDAVSASTDATILWNASADRFDFSHGLRINADNQTFTVGAGGDFALSHNGTDTFMANNTGHFYITTTSDDKDIIFRTDDGSGGVTSYFRVDGSTENVIYQKNLKLQDNVQAQFGTGEDLKIYHNGSSSHIDHTTTVGDLVIRNTATDRHIFLQTDNGSGGEATYLKADGGNGTLQLFHYGSLKASTTSSGFSVTGEVNVTGEYEVNGVDVIDSSRNLKNINEISLASELNFTGNGNKYIDVSTLALSNALTIRHHNPSGNLFETAMIMYANGGTVINYDGSGRLSTTSAGVNVTGFLTATSAVIVDSIFPNTSNSAFSIKNSSEGTIATFNNDLSTSFLGNVLLGDNKVIKLGTNLDLQLLHDGSNSIIKNVATGNLIIRNTVDDGDIILQSDDGSGGLTNYITLDGSEALTKFGQDAKFGDNKVLKFGDSNDLRIYHNGSHSYIDDTGTGNLYIRANNLRLQKYTGETYISADADGAVGLRYDSVEKLATTSGGVDVTGRIKANNGLFQSYVGNLTHREYVVQTSSGGGDFLLGQIEVSSGTDGAVTGCVYFAYDYGTTSESPKIHFSFHQRSGTARGSWWYENDDDSAGSNNVKVVLVDDGSGNMYVWLRVGDYSRIKVTTEWHHGGNMLNSGELSAGTITTGTTLFDTSNDPTSEHHIGSLFAHSSSSIIGDLTTTGGATIGDSSADALTFFGILKQGGSGGTTVIDSSRNLTNIGTISSGAITSSGAIKTANGTESLPAYSFTSDTDTGMFSDTSNQLEFSTGGDSKVTINPSGHLLCHKGEQSVLSATSTSRGIWVSNDTDGESVSYNLALPDGSNNRRATISLDDSTGLWVFDTTASSGVPDIVFKRAGSEKGRFTSSGLSVNGATAISGNYNTSAGGYQIGGTTVINSSRNLTNIGTGSFSDKVTLSGTTDEILTLNSTDNGAIYMSFERGFDRHAYVGFGSSSDAFYIANEESGGSVIITSGNSTALTLNSSQVATFENTIDVKSQSTLLQRWYEGSTEVGRAVSVSSTLMAIGSGDTGVLFNANVNAVYPWQPTTNAGLDNVVDLGISSRKWRDIYFSGNLKVGSTTVIDSSRNLTNIGTISSGAITSSGTFTLSGTGTDNDSHMINFVNGACAIARDNNDLELHAYNAMVFGVSNTSYPTSTERMRIDSSGRLGIGTNSPSFELDVEGNIGMSGNLYHNGDHNTYIGFTADTQTFRTGGTDRVTINNTGVGIGTTSPSSKLDLTGSGTTQIEFNNTGQSSTSYVGNDATGLFVGTTTNHPIRISTNNTEAIRIDTSQRVGIGTQSPLATLHVGSGSGSLNTSATLFIPAGDALMRTLKLGHGTSSATISTDDSSKPMKFHTGGNESVRIDTSGRLGIGTIAPSVPLHITNSSARIRLQDSDGTNQFTTLTQDGGLFTIFARNNTNKGSILFSGTDTSGATEYARFDNSGRLGIGTASPATKLEVAGNITLPSDGQIKFRGTNHYPRIFASSNNLLVNVDNGSGTNFTALTIDNGGTTTLKGGTADTSDHTLIVRNSSNTSLFSIRNDGRIDLGGSQIFDISRNMSNIGTISSGAITSSAGVKIASDNALIGGGASGGDTQLIFWNGTNAYYGRNSLGGSVSQHEFRTGGTTRLTIDSSGNVGIGISSVQTQGALTGNLLEIHEPTFGSGVGGTLVLSSDNTANGRHGGRIIGRARSYVHSSIDFQADSGMANGGLLKFSTLTAGSSTSDNPTERMRIDSSGRLLIGKTAVDNATVGFRFDGASGFASIARDGGEPLYLNRKTSDGDVIKIAKNDSVKGSIGVDNADNLVIEGDSSHSGLQFGTATILPHKNGAVINNNISLGNSTYKFSNLTLGGTATVNQVSINGTTVIDSSRNLTNINSLSVAGYIYHTGDTNTNILFATDTIQLNTGGSLALQANNSAVTVLAKPLIISQGNGAEMKFLQTTSSTTASKGSIQWFDSNSNSCGTINLKADGGNDNSGIMEFYVTAESDEIGDDPFGINKMMSITENGVQVHGSLSKSSGSFKNRSPTQTRDTSS